jgi:hypothetical protein
MGRENESYEERARNGDFGPSSNHIVCHPNETRSLRCGIWAVGDLHQTAAYVTGLRARQLKDAMTTVRNLQVKVFEQIVW